MDFVIGENLGKFHPRGKSRANHENQEDAMKHIHVRIRHEETCIVRYAMSNTNGLALLRYKVAYLDWVP